MDARVCMSDVVHRRIAPVYLVSNSSHAWCGLSRAA
jgi:hypothetical protein